MLVVASPQGVAEVSQYRKTMQDLLFKTANAAERAEALILRREVYSEDAGHAPLDDLDAPAVHLVAIGPAGRVVAASRLVGPECRPFEFEQQVALGVHFDSDARIGLVGRFCVARGFREVPTSIWLHLGMLKLMYLAAKRDAISDLVMYTFSHLLTFYRGAYFKPLGITFFHDGYGEPMHLMSLNIETFQRRYLSMGGSLARSFQSIHVAV